MTYSEAVDACKAGKIVACGEFIGKADRIIVLFGEDMIRVIENGKPEVFPIYAVSAA